MTAITRPRRLSLVSTLLVLALGWFAAPHASQGGANNGFLLFTTDRDNPSNAGMCPDCEEIYRMSPDGSEPTRLTFGGADYQAIPYNNTGADWSHSKKLIAFHSNRIGRIPQIHLMNHDGSDDHLLVSLPRGGMFPSFSQSGNELCFNPQPVSQANPRRDIYIANVHGEGVTNLTSPGQLPGEPGSFNDNFRCDWSPKSNAIAFSSNRHDPAGAVRNDEIYVINADGSDLVRLTGNAESGVPGSDVNPAWSPKGDRIAFESNRTGQPEIWVMNADGSEPTRLTNFEAEPTPSNVSVTKPTWSPTGDRIAFHRRVGLHAMRGHFEIYTMNADGTDLRQITLTKSPGFSGFPSWGKWSNSHR
ncbi:MAG: PD40 domain-containing protein [Acidobacteria bacterium]|nr:PD40 domain-containing protein [Acidobacteriota bacterium]